MKKDLTTIRIDADLKQRLKQRAKKENKFYSALIQEFLEENVILSNKELLIDMRMEFDFKTIF